ncbi:MAG: FAD-dependent thymidylate synthase [Chloroflexota bacterium]
MTVDASRLTPEQPPRHAQRAATARPCARCPRPWRSAASPDPCARPGGSCEWSTTWATTSRHRPGGGSGPRRWYRTVRSDAGLIDYLMRHEHTSPFEMCELKLHVKLPVFVARQWDPPSDRERQRVLRSLPRHRGCVL